MLIKIDISGSRCNEEIASSNDDSKGFVICKSFLTS